MRIILALAALVAGLAGPVAAQDKALTLAADERLDASGLLSFLVPRFALKTGIRVEVVPGDADALLAASADGAADVVVAEEAQARAIRDAGGTRYRAAFHRADESVAYAVVLPPGTARPDNAGRFADWLTSEIGQRTVASYSAADAPAYVPGAVKVAAPAPVLPAGDVDEGEKLAFVHCARCHVISDKNRFGGIGSTPSFGALRNIVDWQDRFMTFYALNPHPSFTQVEGVTEPFDPDRPPHIAPVELTQDELAAIVAFAASVPPKDLGAAVESR